MKPKALLIGSSGLIARELIPKLQSNNFEVVGISNSKDPEHNIENSKFIITKDSFEEFCSNNDFEVIVNGLHSDDYEYSLLVNEIVSDYCIKKDLHYVFLSSSNALDGDTTRPRTEDEIASGRSEYGIYKANCEKYLNEMNKKCLILRFPSILGYYKNGISLIENALKSLKESNEYLCAHGIIQNQVTSNQLSQIISELIKDKIVGTLHLGSDKGFEGFELFEDIAQLYGYDKAQIKPGKKYIYNSTVLPNKIYDLYGNQFKFTRDDVLLELGSYKELQKYKN